MHAWRNKCFGLNSRNGHGSFASDHDSPPYSQNSCLVCRDFSFVCHHLNRYYRRSCLVCPCTCFFCHACYFVSRGFYLSYPDFVLLCLGFSTSYRGSDLFSSCF